MCSPQKEQPSLLHRGVGFENLADNMRIPFEREGFELEFRRIPWTGSEDSSYLVDGITSVWRWGFTFSDDGGFTPLPVDSWNSARESRNKFHLESRIIKIFFCFYCLLSNDIHPRHQITKTNRQ